ncbi:MAG: hypothetical protein SGILL_002999, partial [Bacillariaceae sp.]
DNMEDSDKALSQLEFGGDQGLSDGGQGPPSRGGLAMDPEPGWPFPLRDTHPSGQLRQRISPKSSSTEDGTIETNTMTTKSTTEEEESMVHEPSSSSARTAWTGAVAQLKDLYAFMTTNSWTDAMTEETDVFADAVAGVVRAFNFNQDQDPRWKGLSHNLYKPNDLTYTEYLCSILRSLTFWYGIILFVIGIIFMPKVTTGLTCTAAICSFVFFFLNESNGVKLDRIGTTVDEVEKKVDEVEKKVDEVKKQNNEVIKQNNEVIKQNNEVIKQNKEILDLLKQQRASDASTQGASNTSTHRTSGFDP